MKDDNRSTFVTVIAWLSMIGSGLAMLNYLLQNIMFNFVFKKGFFSQIPGAVPPALENLPLFLLAFLVIALVLFGSSIGLLLRKNWARLMFIFLLALGIVWIACGIFFRATLFSTMPEIPNTPDFNAFKTMFFLQMWFMELLMIGMAGLFVWIITRLLSDPIKQEFTA